MRRFFRTLSSYVWWTHERGSIHYDVMVTLILLFIFLAPFKINFKDNPAAPETHLNQVIAYPDGQGGFVYEVPVTALAGPAAEGLEPQLTRALAPVAGSVRIKRFEAMRDSHGNTAAYRVWAQRETSH